MSHPARLVPVPRVVPGGRSTPVILAAILGFFMAGCGSGGAVPVPPVAEPEWAGDPTGAPPVLPQPEPAPEPAPEVVVEEAPAEAREKPSLPLPDPLLEGWAEETLGRLTLPERVAQLMMPWILGDFSPDGTSGSDRILEMLDRHAVGGVIVSAGSPTEVAVKLNRLQGRSRIPLLVGADLETGAGFRFRSPVSLPGLIDLGGATDFPPLMAVGATGDPQLAYAMGRITAVESRALGVHLPFAPVLDVNNNPDNPVISVRSFGEDPAAVARMGAAFVRGLQEWGATATGKHFPGHGDTDVDSHVDLPVIRATRARLDSLELLPFRMAIGVGMGAVMTAHLAIPELTGSPNLPATLSPAILTSLLRRDLGFDGLIITDALDMQAVDRRFPRGEAAVRAIAAGADLLLMPPDVATAIRAVVSAVQTGRISEERLNESVMRILRLKQEMGLPAHPRIDVEEVAGLVGIPAHLEVAREIAERSITVLRNERSLLPLLGTRTANVTSLLIRRGNDLMAGRTFTARMRRTYPRLREEVLDRGAPAGTWDQAFQRARQADLVVIQAHLPSAVTPPEELARLVERLVEARIPHVVVSFGNPYLVREFPDVQGYVLAWGSQEASQAAAARALLGEIPVTGRTPTVIPPRFVIGDGIQLERR